MHRAGRGGERRSRRTHRPHVDSLETRALLSGSARVDTFPIPTANPLASDLVDGPDGNLWFLEQGGYGRISPQGAVVEFNPQAPTGGLAPTGGSAPTPSSLVAGPDDSIWALDSSGGAIDRISHDGQIQSFPIPGEFTGLNPSIVAGKDGNLWFNLGPTGGNGQAAPPGQIGRITPRGVVTFFPMPQGGGVVCSLAAGPDGIWFADINAGRVGEVDYSGHVVEYPSAVASSAAGPQVAVGPDGDAYYAAAGAGNNLIVRVATGGTMTPIAILDGSPAALVSTPDGIDFLALGAAGIKLDRVAPDGTIATLASLPAWVTSTPSLAIGPDGNPWLLDGNDGIIGRVVLSPSTVPAPGPQLVATKAQASDTYGPTLPGPPAPTVGLASSIVVANFRDRADLTGVSATIDWGDGTPTTAATLGTNPNIPPPSGVTPYTAGQFSGTHTYARAGSFNVTTTLTGTSPDGSTVTTSVVEPVTVSFPSPTFATTSNLQAVKSVPFQGLSAQFTTPEPADPSGTEFQATVNWGDGTPPTAGTVSYISIPSQGLPDATSGASTTFAVSGVHTYASAGSYRVVVTVVDPLGHSGSQAIPMQVAAAPLTFQPDNPVLAEAGPLPASVPQADVFALGNLTDLQGIVTGRTYSLKIDWGDGTAPSDGLLVALPGVFPAPSSLGVQYQVAGIHDYARSGTYTAKLTFADNQGDSTVATVPVTASSTPIGLGVSPLVIGATTYAAGVPILSMPLASFSPFNATDPPSSDSATINWGDGTPPTVGSISLASSAPPQQSAQFDVNGGHTYATAGDYQVTVDVSGPGGVGGVTTIPMSVMLADAGPVPLYEQSPTTSPAGSPLAFVPGQAGAPQAIAIFNSPESNAVAADFHASVNWGDGSPTEPASVTLLPAGSSGQVPFSVIGSHAYALAGSYTPTIIVVGPDGLPYGIQAQAVVADPTPTPTPTPPAHPAPVLATMPQPSPVKTTPIPSPTPVNSSPISTTLVKAPAAIVPLTPPQPPTVLVSTPSMVFPSPFPRFAPVVAPSTGPKSKGHAAPKGVAHPPAPVHVAGSRTREAAKGKASK